MIVYYNYFQRVICISQSINSTHQEITFLSLMINCQKTVLVLSDLNILLKKKVMEY